MHPETSSRSALTLNASKRSMFCNCQTSRFGKFVHRFALQDQRLIRDGPAAESDDLVTFVLRFIDTTGHTGFDPAKISLACKDAFSKEGRWRMRPVRNLSWVHEYEDATEVLLRLHKNATMMEASEAVFAAIYSLTEHPDYSYSINVVDLFETSTPAFRFFDTDSPSKQTDTLESRLCGFGARTSSRRPVASIYVMLPPPYDATRVKMSHPSEADAKRLRKALVVDWQSVKGWATKLLESHTHPYNTFILQDMVHHASTELVDTKRDIVNLISVETAHGLSKVLHDNDLSPTFENDTFFKHMVSNFLHLVRVAQVLATNSKLLADQLSELKESKKKKNKKRHCSKVSCMGYCTHYASHQCTSCGMVAFCEPCAAAYATTFPGSCCPFGNRTIKAV
jgi:hypothetical protein